jgi:hypothetical protein
VAALELCVGTGRSLFSPYLPPHTAATTIQRLYRSYVDKVIKEYLPQHTAATAIQRVYCSYVDKVITVTEWKQRWQPPWMERETCFLTKFSSSGLPFFKPIIFFGA